MIKCGYCGEEIKGDHCAIEGDKYWCGCNIKKEDIKEGLKIISDGAKCKVWIDGREVKNIRKVKFTQSIDEIGLVELELVVLGK